ncbi:hypothetical protein E2P81_ATG10436 [Venturia nashicola]|nr:hypothetical protein E2P81_ATG10436 [Venturia nashicola]
MSTNASSLRRIIRSIGSHAAPSPKTTRASSALIHPSTIQNRPYSGETSSGHATQSHTLDSAQAPASQDPEHALQRDEQTPAAGLGINIRRLELETPLSQVGDLRQSKGNRHYATSSQPTKHLDLPETEVAEKNLFRRQPFDPKVKDEVLSRKRYFEKSQGHDKRRMKESARRRQLSSERHPYREDRAWADILTILEEHSSSNPKTYVRRMETIRLPQGIFAKWIGDPAEVILEIMQRTGSHVQVIPGKRPGIFSSLTLRGTPFDNAAAKKLLQESNYLAAVSHDGLNTSKPLAEYELHSEVSASQKPPKVEKINASASDKIGTDDPTKIEGLMSDITNMVPTRAVWSRSRHPVEDEPVELNEDAGQASLKGSKYPLPSSAVALTQRVEQLAEDRPRRFGRTNNDFIRDELLALLTNSNLAPLITLEALRIAMRYLVLNRFFPAVRSILNALEDAKVHVDATCFNVLLNAAARDENVLAFHYVIHTMRDRAVSMDAGTWMAFHALTLNRFPQNVQRVISLMETKSVHASDVAKTDIPENYAAAHLNSYLSAHPNATMKDFIDHMKHEMPHVQWLTCFSVNSMCRILLKRGNTFMAFEAVDELVRSGGRPDAITLNTFLTAAKWSGSMDMAVAVLRKFHDLEAKSFALACKEGQEQPILSRKHDLRITLNRISYRILFSIAWTRRNFNCLRVFWRYACCAGGVHPVMRKDMDRSAEYYPLVDIESSRHAHVRLLCAARFAMGVHAGVDDSENAKIIHAAHGVRHESKTPPDSELQGLMSKETQLSDKSATKKRLAIIAADVGAVESLRPKRPLVDIIEEAWMKDRSWKDDRLGNANSQGKHGSPEEMVQVMLKTGIEVPMKEGNCRRMKL